MKKLLIFVLAILMLIGMAACGDPEPTKTSANSTVSSSGPKPTESKPMEPKPTTPKPTDPRPTNPKPTEHTHDYTATVTAPTCTKSGYTTYTCTCGDTYQDNEIPATGHSEVIRDATEATCIDDGKTEGVYCSVCYEVIVEQKTIPATGIHAYGTDHYCAVCGQIDEAYLLSTPEDLSKLTDSSELYYIKNDIDLAGINWTPIAGFKGTLVGNGCTIKNLTINTTGSDVGFFSVLEGTVKDLRFVDASVSVSGEGEDVGILCGELTGSIESISVSGTVSALKSEAVGGIAGYVEKHGSYTLTNLKNAANVSGFKYTGGVIGYLYDSMEDNKNYALTLTDFENSGIITGGEYTGGILGITYTDSSKGTVAVYISEFSNTGDVEGTNYVGGLIGWGYSNTTASYIVNSTNASMVKAEAVVGAIAGELDDIGIDTCDNTGSTIIADKHITVDSNKKAYVGGYAGCGSWAKNCTNYAAITYTGTGSYVGGIMGATVVSGDFTYSNLSNTVDISGNDYTGGIFGNATTRQNITFSNLTNTGNISGKDLTGGIIGYLYNGLNVGYTNFSMNMSEFKNSGNVKGENYTGGTIGYLYARNTYNASYYITLKISGFSNTGAVSGADYVGGLLGHGETDYAGSAISNSTNVSSVTADAVVGTIAGHLDLIGVDNCENKGSSITASKYITENDMKCAYVGGMVGKGTWVTNCTNYATIIYTGAGDCIGGIMGYTLVGDNTTFSDLSNTVEISANDYTGGIFGYVNASRNITFSNLTNTGNITGKDYTGGLIGIIMNKQDVYGAKDTMTLTALENSGQVSGDQYTGGIVGYLYAHNTYSASYYVIIQMTDTSNSAAIKGEEYVGGLVGYAYSDNASSSISNVSNASSVDAEAVVGAIAGQLVGIGIDSCENKGSSITANKYISESGAKNAYVGGMVGKGTWAINCTNEATITYTGAGDCVGGIMGCARVGNNATFSNLSNIIEISANAYTGGIFGQVIADRNTTFSDLSNTANISGKDYTGGLFGSVMNKLDVYGAKDTMTLTALENSGKVTGSKYTAGIVGYIYAHNTYNANYYVCIYMSDITNTGAVKGTTYVGGLIGYGYSDIADSFISDSSNVSSVSADAVVGAIAGQLDLIGIDSCENKGSTVTATKYITENNTKCAYVGGMVGRGAWAKDCTNYVTIQYTGGGSYVAGIIGYVQASVDSVLTELSNSADISGADYTAGIAGYINKSGNVTISDLENTANISGKDYTSGLIGAIMNKLDAYGRKDTITLTALENSGKVTGSKYTAGIVGYIYAHNTYNANYYVCIYMSDITNTGAVKGTTYVGGLVGYGYSDSNQSTISDYTSTGKVTGNSEKGTVAGKLESIAIVD